MKKEIGKIKRSQTIAANKQVKIAEHNRKLHEKLAKDEQDFQIERARRIAELHKKLAKDEQDFQNERAKRIHELFNRKDAYFLQSK